MCRHKIYHVLVGVLFSLAALTGCVRGQSGGTESAGMEGAFSAEMSKEDDRLAGQNSQTPAQGQEGGEAIRYEVIPETFALTVEKDGVKIPVSGKGPEKRVEHFAQEGTTARWEYPDDQIAVTISQEEEFLHVTIVSQKEEDNCFEWPHVSGKSYYLPFGEGKRVPGDDEVWKNYLNGGTFSVMEQLSMPFFAVSGSGSAVMYLMEQPFRSDLVFSEGDTVKFSLAHRFAKIDPEKSSSFRIYITDDSPTAVAKQYRQYVMEQGAFVTLEQKAEKNPDIRKLYGAPFIYLWGENGIAPEDIDWAVFRRLASRGIPDVLKRFAGQTESGKEALEAVRELAGQDYAGQYQKNVICRYISELLKREDFYDPRMFPVQDDEMKALLQKGIANLNKPEVMKLNKHALAVNLPGVFRPAEEWMNRETVDLIGEWKTSGLERAWIGLNSWEQAYAKPELAAAAVDQGYLIGPYDSYHSIHEPGKEQWITAAFPDESLYEAGTVLNQDGEKEAGFQGVGRKLNPTLSMPAVKQRVGEIASTGIPFNSWFIDCDATGEIYDDYTPEHTTTQQEDLSARLERMAYIRDERGMVIGSEGGGDFAAPVIAFAHGIELKSFSWMDDDMKKNKESEYYIGNYYSPTGGVAPHFAKRIPVKEEYRAVFVDPKYDLPLYRLVYNDSVITSYHWDWSTFKIIGATKDRMLREILYNTPPLYHLDREEWEEYKEDIRKHTGVWSGFAAEAVQREMTEFENLTDDGTVQRCGYGEGLAVTANFGDVPYAWRGEEIPAHSLVIEMDGKQSVYTPDVAAEHQ